MYAASYSVGTNVDLEKEYSPSRSSNRAIDNDPNVLINKFIEIHREETERVSEVYETRCDVHYGDSERECVDIYFKGNESNTPIFVYVHGGYWVALDKSSSGICVVPLVEQGYRVIAVDYNLCPSVTLAELVEQMKKFLKFLLEYAVKTNARSISLSGHSAGAHLIASLFDTECMRLPHVNLIKDVFLISGVYDLRELRTTHAANPENILSLNADLAEQLSPILYRIPRAVRSMKIHLMVAEHDSCTFRRQSEEFCEKLKAYGVPAYYEEFSGYDHFTIIEDMRDDQSLVTSYIINALYNSLRKL